jgi:serine/threonine protein kinase/Flp pilus assembly protein TadD
MSDLNEGAGPLDEASSGLISSATPAVNEQVELLLNDMAERWRRGEQLGVETYLELHPWLLEQPETVLELIAEELNLRLETGQDPQTDEFVRRFPRLEPQVRAMVECHRLLIAHPAQFPSAGESLGEFRLLAELGRGAHGRVFLAVQPSLADRCVVLKVTPRLSDEHLSLSRLLHTHIVPLYAVHDFPERGLRGLCQPFLGGATLAELQESLRRVPLRQRKGNDVIRALGGIQGNHHDVRHPQAPACLQLNASSYVESICWIAACLGDALHHAHERGLLHLDLKPSNVLLASDGQPMLLDFHLARPPLAPGDPAPARLGGTPAYMPPEQEEALAAAALERPVPATVDRRTDVYSLGVLVFELLTDQLPPRDEAGRTLRQRNPQVTPGLAAVVNRCLAADPSSRYPTARELAADLRRYLDDLPLRGVADCSLAERWRKWRRRRPLVLPLLVLLAAGLGAAASWSLHVVRQVHAAETAVKEGEGYLETGRYAEALNSFRYGAALTEAVPFTEALSRRLHGGMDRADQQLIATELHALAEKLRPLDGIDWLPPESIASAEQQSHRLWENRARIAECFGAIEDVKRAQQLRADLLDLAIIHAHLRVRLRTPGDLAAHEQALGILTQAEETCGPSCILFRECAIHAHALGKEQLAAEFARRSAESPPHGAWEHYALGRACSQSGDSRQAIINFDRALALEPQSLWPQFARGLASYQLGEFTEAYNSFSICVALAPSDAACVYNRGRALVELGKSDRAAVDFDRAAQLDPSLASVVALSRADLYRRKGALDRALSELEHARSGAPPAVFAFHAALIHLDRQDQAAAEAKLREALRHDPTHEQARRLLERLRLTP